MDPASGSTPQRSLIQASDGNLYGFTSSGGLGYGVIFKYDINTNTYTDLYPFANKPDGANPLSTPIEYLPGTLYGTTNGGGINKSGTIFKYDFVNGYTKIYDFLGYFPSLDGENPYNSLMKSSTNVLYGTTFNGGSNNLGTIYRYIPTLNSYLKLYDFNSVDGYSPQCTLTEYNNILYGVTTFGGTLPTSNGTLFTFNPINLQYTVKKEFNIALGYSPANIKLLEVSGVLYGTTQFGGTFANGTIFEYNIANDTLNYLYNFSGYTTYLDGSQPTGGLVYSNGYLYGLTSYGGALNSGMVYRFNIRNNTYQKLYDFSGASYTDGSFPLGDLTLANDGYFYGLTSYGGGGPLKLDYGSIFRINSSDDCEIIQSVSATCATFSLISYNLFNGPCATHSYLNVSVSGGSQPYIYSITNLVDTFSASTNDTGYTFYNLYSGVWQTTIKDSLNNVLTIPAITITNSFAVTSTVSATTTNGNQLCFTITGGTSPYSIYIDDILQASGVTATTSCYTVSCGPLVTHTYRIEDSSSGCTTSLNQPIFLNYNFSGNTDWILTGPFNMIIANDYLEISQDLPTFGISNSYWAKQNYIFPFGLPSQVKYFWELTTEDVSNVVSNPVSDMFITTPFTSSASPLIYNLQPYTYYSGFTTFVTNYVPTVYSGYGFTIDAAFNSLAPFKSRYVRVDNFQMKIVSYTGSCNCVITGSTSVPCLGLTLFLSGNTNPSCDEVSNGQISVYATGGTSPYSYSASGTTTIYVNNTGIFDNLNSGTWYLSVTDSNSVTANLTLPITLINSFYANIVSYVNGFCVTITGGTKPYNVYLGTTSLGWNDNNTTNCYSADCSTLSMISVRDSSY